jgi:hypothetical protein
VRPTLLTLLLSLFVAWAIEVPAQGPLGQVAFEIRETAGLRRFGYPVTAHLTLPAGALRDIQQAHIVNSTGKPIPAQLTAMAKHADGSVRQLEVDLNVSLGPLESIPLRLEYGADVTPTAPKQGLSFAETEDAFRVSAYTIRKDARPLISSIRYGREYLGSAGLNVVLRQGDTESSLSGKDLRWTVEKQGAYQVRLRCDGTWKSDGGGESPWTVTLEFASSKSWVGISQSVDRATTAHPPMTLGITADLQMSGRLLWDLDVGYWLYGVLEPGENLQFVQAESWSCRLGKAEQETEYAKATTANSLAAGWGHFQEARDQGNVIAFGVRNFASGGQHRLELRGDGRWQLQYSPSTPGPTRLSASLHFIPVPLQHTARTSPASMMAPLEVVR